MGKSILFFFSVLSLVFFITPAKTYPVLTPRSVHPSETSFIAYVLRKHNIKDPFALARLIVKNARKYNLSPFLIYAVIKTETHFKYNAVSDTDARGYMQVEPATAVIVAGSSDSLFSPAGNIAIGTEYLAGLIRYFGDVNKALSAYNYGPTRVILCGINKTYYSESILREEKKLKKIFKN